MTMTDPAPLMPLADDDREAKERILTRAKSLMAPKTPGKHARITRATVSVLEVLLQRRDASTGICNPTQKEIAEAAGCVVATVAVATMALERAGILTWVRERNVNRNNYRFIDPQQPSMR